MLQLKIGIANTFLIISVLLIILYFTTEGSKLINTNDKGTYLIGFYMPIIGLITNFVASKLTKKDEEMVRSAYRMR